MSSRDGPIAVLIVGEDPLARGGIASLLEEESSVRVVGEASFADDLVADAARGRPDVALVDLAGEKRAALGALRSLEAAQLPALVLCQSAALGSQALDGGARGAVLRSASQSQLARALAAVADGLLVFDPSLAPTPAPRPVAQGELAEVLTPREIEVLQLLSLGLSNKEIAARLAISEHTAKFHVNAILAKLGVQGRTEAVVRAARLGLVVL